MSHSVKGICSCCALGEKWLGSCSKVVRKAYCMLPSWGVHLSFFLSFFFLTLIIGVVMGSKLGNGFRLNTLEAQYRTKLPSPGSKDLWVFHLTTPDMVYQFVA